MNFFRHIREAKAGETNLFGHVDEQIRELTGLLGTLKEHGSNEDLRKLSEALDAAFDCVVEFANVEKCEHCQHLGHPAMFSGDLCRDCDLCAAEEYAEEVELRSYYSHGRNV